MYEWDEYSKEPRITHEEDSVTIYLSESDLSGESVYLRLKEYVEKLRGWYVISDNIQEYKQFYDELKLLCERHTVAKDALRTLMER